MQDRKQQKRDEKKAAGGVGEKRGRQEIDQEYREERKRRRVEVSLPSIPPLPLPEGTRLQLQADISSPTVHGSIARRNAVCHGFLRSVFASGTPIYSTRHMLPYLRSQLRDGGYLPSDHTAFNKSHAPPVISEQLNNIRARIFKERDYKVSALVDETSDTAGGRRGRRSVEEDTT